eukprot:2143769-Ditylum_brightwellii.AAC.1
MNQDKRISTKKASVCGQCCVCIKVSPEDISAKCPGFATEYSKCGLSHPELDKFCRTVIIINTGVKLLYIAYTDLVLEYIQDLERKGQISELSRYVHGDTTTQMQLNDTTTKNCRDQPVLIDFNYSIQNCTDAKNDLLINCPKLTQSPYKIKLKPGGSFAHMQLNIMTLMTQFLKVTFSSLHLLADEDRNEHLAMSLNNCIEGNAAGLKNVSCSGFASHIDGMNSKVQPRYWYTAVISEVVPNTMNRHIIFPTQSAIITEVVRLDVATLTMCNATYKIYNSSCQLFLLKNSQLMGAYCFHQRT